MNCLSLSEEQKDDTNDLLNNAKDKITEVSKDIFNKGQENSEVINKIGEQYYSGRVGVNMDNIKIKELAKTAVGKEFTLKGEIKVSEKVSSNNGNKYLSVEINDGTGVIYDNIFDDRGKLYDEVKNLDNAGRYEITGKIRSVREGTKGFNAIIISKIDLIKGSIKITKDKKELSDEFKKIFKTITNKAYRDLITKCFKEIEQDIFYTVPVSENHYLYKGGLADHIIRTNEIINSIVDSYKGGLNYDKDLS